MSSVVRYACACLASSALIIGWLAAPVQAGTYRVYSCKTPSGTVAPTDGWSASSIAQFTSPQNGCASGGSLNLALAPDINNPATASLMTWRWEAPSGAAIVSYRVWRTAQLTPAYEPNATPVVFVARPVNALSSAYVSDGCRLSDGCTVLGGAPGINPSNLITENLESMGNVDRWFMNVDCGGVAGYNCVPRPAGSPTATVSIYGAEFTLRDTQPPASRELAGRLSSGATHSGTEIASFTVSDSQAGVYRAFLEVDGKTLKSAVMDSNDGRCADAGVDPTTPYEFLYREPCPKSVQYDMSFDTTTVADGTHKVRVLVEDASGNRTSVLSAPEFVVKNGGPGAGGSTGAGGAGSTGAANDGGTSGARGATASACNLSVGGITARFSRTDAARATVRHGGAFTIKGRAPANVDIDVFHVRGSKVTALGSLRTSAGGTFNERFRSRQGGGTIQLCGPGVAASLTLRVKAKVTFKVKLSRYGLVRYSGRVATGQIPKGGKIVAIQGKAGSSWQTFALRRTDRTGRFKGRYRLRVVIPGAKLKFRVRVPSEAGYPFVGVVSKPVTKRVR